jgi:hypothetical protein
MSNELVVHEFQPERALTVQEIKAQVQVIQKVMAEVMIKDSHYGTLPGTSKPTLYKAGAEKILSTFRISVTPLVEELSGPDERRFRVVARGISPSGILVGEGIGEASTDEEKYRWRGAVCDAEFDETPEDRRRVKYARSKGGGHYTLKQVRTAPADLSNTVLKMAKKRALVDLCLTATACSDIFEQDLEDFSDEERENLISDRKKKERKEGKPSVTEPKQTGEATNNESAPGECISTGQQRMLAGKLEAAGLTSAALIEHLNAKGMNVNVLADIEQAELTKVVKAIDGGEVKPC